MVWNGDCYTHVMFFSFINTPYLYLSQNNNKTLPTLPLSQLFHKGRHFNYVFLINLPNEGHECKDKVYLYVSSMRIKKLQIKLNSITILEVKLKGCCQKKKKSLYQLSIIEIYPIFVDTIYLILD